MVQQLAPVHVIGGGLAGCEAAFQLVSKQIPVILHEMRPQRMTDAHHTSGLAELVCSNSFRSDDATANAVGVLHEEMRQLGSLIISSADTEKVPAGGALAVDRERFSAAVEAVIAAHPLITIERQEVTHIPDSWDQAFFDAIAPIIHFDSINTEIVWFQSRYDKSTDGGDGKDYINCPLNKAQYDGFIDALLTGEKMQFKEWEANTPYFDGCMPIEVMASRGPETLRWGPMKPVGLTNAHDQSRPHAVIQLRQDNALGTLYNMVGFQTKLKYAEQTRIFRTIPGLENAEFARLGGLHRNTFINAPRLLDSQLRFKSRPKLRFAGQITGVEGYVESAAIGLLAGRMAASDRMQTEWVPPPADTAHGALLSHITGGAMADSFQPMNVNFGLFPQLPTDERGRLPRGRDRKAAYAKRALTSLQHWAHTA